MVRKTTSDKLTEILVKVGKIEQHMADMNGRVRDANIHITKTCPTIHKDLDRSVIKNSLIISGIWAALMAILISKLQGWI